MQLQSNQQVIFKQQVAKFITFLKQQLLSCDILPYQRQLFSYLNKSLQEQEQTLKQYVRGEFEGGESSIHTKNLTQRIYKCETQKIRYLLKEYLRVRLKKIQKYCFYLYKNQSQSQVKLSENQYNFMKKYAEMKFNYLDHNVIETLPKPYRGLGGMEAFFTKSDQVKVKIDTKQSNIQIPEPLMDEYVFCLIKSNQEQLRFNSDIPINNIEQNSIIPINSILYTQYRYISKMVKEQNAVLI